MKKITKIFIAIVLILIFISIGYKLYMNYRIKHAIIKVETIDNLDIEVYSDVKLKDLIESINGKLIKNKKIDTTKVGKQDITFEYINEENLKVEYSFEINIVDITPPMISYTKNFTFYKGTKIDLKSKFFCGDNYDDKPTCEIIGDYNLNEIGDYNLTFKATDSSENESVNNFTVHVIEKPEKTENNNTSTVQNPVVTNFSDIITNYKTKDTKIGIDVSKWQGNIDYEKLKEAGVEFVFIRVGNQKGKNGEYILDDNFVKNIKGFNKVNIPVGVYFFSYADTNKEAENQAKWVLKQIKKYKVELPIVFDWENWKDYRDYNLSFYHLTQMANTFIKEVETKGYDGMLYSSKNYLEKIWFKPNTNIWLAHYTNQTNYEGEYKVWQICDDGKIDGIEGSKVDIDIMYK